MRNYSRVTASETIESFGGSAEFGLSNAVVPSLLVQYGPNKLKEEEKDHVVLRYLEKFKDPLILLLLGSAVLSIIVRQYDDAISIIGAVIIVGSVAFYQETKSEESLEALKDLVPHKCNVVRNGNITPISAENLVPGDTIRLQSGDRVPADARIISCNSLTVDESTLTGETEPKDKTSDPLPDLSENCDVTECSNLVFMGTLICSGHAVCIVIATGSTTEFGKTIEEMKEMDNRRTPLQVKMDELGKTLSIISMGIIVCIGLIGMFQGQSFLAMFNIGVSLAVAAIPEGLPICVTVTLALGVMRMAKKNAIIKKLPAVEALGCADYICTDKTGTLTENKMTVMAVFTPSLEDIVHFNHHGHTHHNNSNDHESSHTSSNNSDHNVDEQFNLDLLKKQQQLLQHTNHHHHPHHQQHTLSYRGEELDIQRYPSIAQLFDSFTMCNNASILHTGKYSGQPTEGALLVAAKTIGVQDRRSSTQRSQETSFTSETKYMEVVYAEREHGSSPYLQQHHRHAGDVKYLKGALEVILPQCVTYLSHAGDLQLLSPAILDRVYSYASELSNDGLRVLATACGTTHNQLVFLGIAGLRDPLRAGVADAVHRIKGSGATVMMITGDAESTAVSIARLAGIYEPSLAGQRILSGREIEELVAMGDDALSSVIDSVAVCYRTSPRQKLSIVRALQSRGHVVAMTGDGVNDASALKCADIGVAMGSGTDVAKEAADMVVVDDNFATIVAAIEEGKSIFFNIKNFITFQLSTSVAALSLVALNNMIGRPNPLNPMQILWINIIMDGPLAQSLGVEIVDPAVMQRPPRKRNEEIISRPVQYRIITSGMLILLGTMYIFLHEMEDGAIVTKRDLTMTFTTFVMFDMFNALACRHNSRSIFEMSWNSNSAFLLAAAFSIIGQILVVYFPPLQRVFRTESLTFEDISFVVALSSSMVLLDSLRKRYFPHIFTENLQSMSDGSAKKGLKSGAFMV